MARVLLLLSPSENAILHAGTSMIPPLSLGVIASVLKENGHDVQLVDLNAVLRNWKPSEAKARLAFLYSKSRYLQILESDANSVEEQVVHDLLSAIDLRHIDVAGISLGGDISFLQIHLGLLIANVLQRRHATRVVIGGGNVGYIYMFSEVFRDLWRAILPRFPWIITGAGEMPFLNLLSGAAKRSTPGLIYREHGELHSNAPCAPRVVRPDFDTLDMRFYAAYLEKGDGVPALEKNIEYLYKWPSPLLQLANSIRSRLDDGSYERRPLMPYVFNYRCPFRCAFCSQSGDPNKSVIIGEPDSVVDDVLYLMERWQSEHFYFINNAFNNSPVFADRFCEEVVRRRARFYWSDCCRFNALTEERIIAMREAGCRRLTFGFEAGSRAMLQYIDKRIELDQAEQALEWCRKHDVAANLEIIVGLPYETESRFQETVDFLARNRERINSVSITKYFVVPTSLIGLYPERYGIELVRNYMTYDGLLKLNYEGLCGESAEKVIVPENLEVHRFNELSPFRMHWDVDSAAREHMKAIIHLRVGQFEEVMRTHQMIHRTLVAADAPISRGGSE